MQREHSEDMSDLTNSAEVRYLTEKKYMAHTRFEGPCGFSLSSFEALLNISPEALGRVASRDSAQLANKQFSADC